MQRCNNVKGKLFNVEDCAELESVNAALKARAYDDGEEFFLGTLKNGMARATNMRRSAPGDTEVNS